MFAYYDAMATPFTSILVGSMALRGMLEVTGLVVSVFDA